MNDMTRFEITEYSATQAALATLAHNYKSVVYQVATMDGMRSAKAARSDIKGYRVDLEKMRKEIKEPALRRCQLIDDEARRITAELVALENPIDAQIKTEEQRVEELRGAAIRAEQASLEAEAKAKREAEEKELAEARAEIARREAVLAEAEKAQLAHEAESRRKIEEQERAARLKIEEDQRAARAVIEVEEKRLRDIRIAEEKELRAKQREEERLKNELLDGREMLETFIARFGQREEFKGVAAFIKGFLESFTSQITIREGDFDE